MCGCFWKILAENCQQLHFQPKEKTRWNFCKCSQVIVIVMRIRKLLWATAYRGENVSLVDIWQPIKKKKNICIKNLLCVNAESPPKYTIQQCFCDCHLWKAVSDCNQKWCLFSLSVLDDHTVYCKVNHEQGKLNISKPYCVMWTVSQSAVCVSWA